MWIWPEKTPRRGAVCAADGENKPDGGAIFTRRYRDVTGTLLTPTEVFFSDATVRRAGRRLTPKSEVLHVAQFGFATRYR